MINKRIDELSFMMSEITGIEKSNCQKIIETTKTGKAILKNNPLVLYEQQTSNLAEIANDLDKNKKYKSISSTITIDKVIEASKRLRNYERAQESKAPLFYLATEPELEKKQRRNLTKTQKCNLKQNSTRRYVSGGIKMLII